ncbi:hypothetical protein H2200_007162 [Cladophialophora chaetospira]|uniref:Xylanolytic transcriptional activator regulatory domain-containing protein n=1 Tax=Cladophialophora chaetospira TaxID=386627 RepID=A0AA39CH76_9EURO|nr:hypothetical protein H2200_007162 [Cladophialophora chaetospira]
MASTTGYVMPSPHLRFEAHSTRPTPVWKPIFPPDKIPMNIYRRHVNEKFQLRLKDSQELHSWSITEPQAFWIDLWDYVGLIPKSLGTKQAYDPAIPISEVPPFFEGTTINYAENVLTQPLVDSQIPALIGLREGQGLDGEVWTWSQLRENVRKARSALLRSGINRGDRVAALISTSVWSVGLFLASASIGAIFTSIAPDLGFEGCISRLQQVQPSILFADSHTTYKGQRRSNCTKISEILKLLRPSPEIFVIPTGPVEVFQPLSTFLGRSTGTDKLDFARLPFTAPLYILYSSGTSGPPKCLVHSHAAILQHKKIGMLHNSLRPGEVVFQYSSTSWVLWNIMVGHLAMGTTLVMYDGSPTWPQPQSMLKIVEKFSVNYWGVSPKYLKELESTGCIPKREHDLSSLRMVQTGGSHLASDQYYWFYKSFPSTVHLTSVTGGTDLVTSWCGTDPAGPLYPGEIQMPILGHDVDIADPIHGHSIKTTGEAGEFVCRKPFPSMPVYMWGDTNNEKYKASYFSQFPFSCWAQHDWASVNPLTKGWTVHGRSDGVLNPQGIRFGSAEIYSITEAAPFSSTIDITLCVGRKRRGIDSDESVFLFVVMRLGQSLSNRLKKELQDAIRQGLSARHVPRFVAQVKEIPMTSNGKKVETLVKEVISTGEMPRTISSTVVNSGCLEAFRQYYSLEPPNARLSLPTAGDRASPLPGERERNEAFPGRLRSVAETESQTRFASTPRAALQHSLNVVSTPDALAEPSGTLVGESPEYVAATQSHVGRSRYLGSRDFRFREEMIEGQTGTPPLLSTTDLELLQVQKVFDFPQRSVLASLVDNYFQYCSPWTPMLEHSDVEELQRNRSSPLLLNALLLAGSRVTSSVILSASPEDFYRKARLLFVLGHERDALASITAVILLQWYNPTGPEHVSTSTSGFWVRIAAGLAYQLGLHREPTIQKDRKLRRRLWWSVVCRDDIISIGTGRPRTINLDDSNVALPTTEDFVAKDPEARLFVEFSCIIRILADLTENIRRKTLTRKTQTHLENALYRWIKYLPSEFHLFGGSPKRLSSYDLNARQLLIPFFVVLFILSRHPHTRTRSVRVSFVASSFVAGIYEDLLNRDELCHCGPVFTFYAFAAGLAQMPALRYRTLVDTAEESLSIIKSSLEVLKKRWGSADGALTALAQMKRLTIQSPPLGEAPDPELADFAPFFDDFGPELCKQYHLLQLKNPTSDAVLWSPPTFTSADSRQAVLADDLNSPVTLIDRNQEFIPQRSSIEHAGDVLLDQSNLFFGDMDPLGSWMDVFGLDLASY